MTPEQLKASILQYAIQGKLVEQRPEEGSGEELYQQIQTEKQRLIQEKKIKKEKPLAEISEDEIPFDIPESWKWVKVGNVGSWSSGATPSRTNPAYYGGTIPWLKTGDLNDGFIKEIPEFITDLALEKTSVRLNPVGSVLMAMYGATIGKLGILDISATTNQACCACIPYEGMHNKYLFYYLMSMRRSYIGMAEGGAQPNISKEKIVNSLIPLPPLAEQKRIVAKIEELIPLVDRYAAAYEKLEQFNAKFPEDMKKSILQYAIQGKLVEQRAEEGTGEELYQQIKEEIRTLEKQKKFKVKDNSDISKDEIPFDIPESWKWVRLGQILNIESGKGLTAKQMKPGEIPVFGGNGITGYHNESLIEKETVVIGRVGFYCGSVHITPTKAWVTDNAFITTYPEECINREYLVYVLRHMDLGQKSNATAQPVVSGKKIYPMIFPLPPLAEQKRIVAKIEEILPLCERLK